MRADGRAPVRLPANSKGYLAGEVFVVNADGTRLRRISSKPANLVFTPELPKTRSGKIMRRLLRDVAENRPLGDTTTLADPAVVAEIAEQAAVQPADE